MIESVFLAIENLLRSDSTAIIYSAIWLVVFLAGENGALLVFMLALQGFFSTPQAVFFVFLGSLSADLFWYGVTVSTVRPWFDRRFNKKLSKDKNENNKPLFEIADKHPYVVLIFIKFLVGIRLILTIYIVAKKRIPFLAYLACNFLANIIFVLGLISLAWFFNESAGQAIQVEQSITYTLTLVTIAGIGGNILLRLLHRGVLRFLKRRTVSNPAGQ